jgi:hypothetical protein
MASGTRSLGTVLTFLVLAFCGLIGSGLAAEADAACPPYEVIGARGSGQKEHKDELNMGPEVHDFFASVQSLLGTGVVKGYGVQYPAVDVKSKAGLAAGLHLGGSYTDSVREGADDVKIHIQVRRQAGCGSTKYILAGYSQGAQVMGDVLRDSDIRKSVAAVALFGDPYFNADSPSSRGTFDSASYGVFGPRPEWPSDLAGHVFSYCHWHDAICNDTVRHHVKGTDADAYVRSFDDVPGRLAAHGTPAYRLTQYGGQGDAWLAARDVARVLGFVPSPLPYSGPLDIAFVIDSTGSMSDEIEEVKENVAALVAQIAAIDPDYRLALVDYKDEPEEDSEYQSRLDLDFTTDVGAFDRELSGLLAYGGGDEPESVFSGLMTALGRDWRAGAKKIVVQIGDAPAKDPEPITGLTLRAVQAKALSVDPATVDTIQSGEEADTTSSFSAIAAATGGQNVQLPGSDLSGLVPAIVDEIRRNTTAPAATLTAPSLVVAGVPVTLSAAASHDVGEAIAGYDWDFDGDGVFDTSTADPVANHTYPAPTSTTAVVRVRSASGLSSLATAPITVTEAVASRPHKPKHLRASLHGSTLTLTWAAGKGPLPQWFTVFDTHGHSLTQLPVSGETRRFSVVVPGLHRQRVYRFSVAAGSEGGESKRAGPVLVGGKKRDSGGQRTAHHDKHHRHRHQR